MSEYVILSSDELMHHGIFGMRWGHRNGPPYPLNDEDHSALEKKAEKMPRKEWQEYYAERLEKKASNAESKAAYQKRISDAKIRTMKANNETKRAKQDVKEVKKTGKITSRPEEEVKKVDPKTVTPEEKEAILKSADPKKIYANRDLFTTNELNEAIIRINKERELKKLFSGEEKTKDKGKEFINKMNKTTQTLSSVVGAVGSAKKAFEMVGEISKTLDKNTTKSQDSKSTESKPSEKKQETKVQTRAVSDVIKNNTGNISKSAAEMITLYNSKVMSELLKDSGAYEIIKELEEEKKKK